MLTRLVVDFPLDPSAVVSVLIDLRRGGLTLVSSITSSSFAYVVTETVVVSVLKLSLYLLVQVDLLVALSKWQVVDVSEVKPGLAVFVVEAVATVRHSWAFGVPVCLISSGPGSLGAPLWRLAISEAASRAAAMRTRNTSGLQSGRRSVYVRLGEAPWDNR